MEESRTRGARVAVPAPRNATADDLALLARLRAGDEAAFADIVDRWSRAMLSVARGHVSTDASAQEVVQDTWLAVIRGLDAFEARSSLKTWVFRILVNTAKTRGVREGRSVPMSSLVVEFDGDGPTVDPSRFRGPDDQYPGGWAPHGVPQRWDADPERAAQSAEVRGLIAAALEELPERQRSVVVLRDVEGCDSDEVCEILGVSAANQRVLLHRGRARVRAALEDYYRRDER
jgi:RNA polymerase sigma-70 factor, ECF subfamily